MRVGGLQACWRSLGGTLPQRSATTKLVIGKALYKQHNVYFKLPKQKQMPSPKLMNSTQLRSLVAAEGKTDCRGDEELTYVSLHRRRWSWAGTTLIGKDRDQRPILRTAR